VTWKPDGMSEERRERELVAARERQVRWDQGWRWQWIRWQHYWHKLRYPAQHAVAGCTCKGGKLPGRAGKHE
jgi:hypothetical protein